jgi:uncharacterized coiled-coil protein SlyX
VALCRIPLDLLIVRATLGLDFLAPAAWSISERGLVADVTPVWAGVREYDGRREFRDPAQLKAPGFLRTLERLPLVLGHPVDRAHRYVYLAVSASPSGDPLDVTGGNAAVYPHSLYQVGSCGDSITWTTRDGIEVPQQRATVTSAAAIARIVGLGGEPPGNEVSLGFLKHVIQEPGVYVNPEGVEIPYDHVQIIDPDDPRVPVEMRRWVGANYLGVGFTAAQSRGGYTTMTPAAGVDARPEGRKAPRVFHLVRQGDETGVSGLGHVLDGVIWPDGQVATKWCVPGKPSEVNLAKSFADWRAIHVDAHPSNRSLVYFDDQPGPLLDDAAPAAPSSSESPPASEAASPVQDKNMDPQALQKMIDELKMQLAAKDKMIEELNAKLAAAGEDMAKKAAGVDAKIGEIAKLEAELAPYRKAAHEQRVTEAAKVAGVDAKEIAGDDPEVSAMRARIAKGLDAKPSGEYADNPVYLRARFDILKQSAPASSAQASSAFSQAVGAAVGVDTKSTPVNDFAALP